MKKSSNDQGMTIETTAVVSGMAIAGMLEVVGQSAVSPMPDFAQVIVTAGLGGGLAWILMKHVMSEQKRAVDRLAKVEDSMIEFTRNMVKTVGDFTSEIRSLVTASHQRGEEVNKMLDALNNRPCLHEFDQLKERDKLK